MKVVLATQSTPPDVLRKVSTCRYWRREERMLFNTTRMEKGCLGKLVDLKVKFR